MNNDEPQLSKSTAFKKKTVEQQHESSVAGIINGALSRLSDSAFDMEVGPLFGTPAYMENNSLATVRLFLTSKLATEVSRVQSNDYAPPFFWNQTAKTQALWKVAADAARRSA